MKLISFEYDDLSTKWFLNKFVFNNVNLLVGVSGVGKTKILNSLFNIKKIALGRMENIEINGVKWGLKFEHSGSIYNWNGKFEHVTDKANKNIKSKSSSHEYVTLPHEDEYPNIIFEMLTKKTVDGDEVTLFSRDKNSLELLGHKVPKITPYKSVLNLFNEEGEIKIINDAFKRLLFVNYELESSITIMNKEKNLEKPASFAELRNNSLPILAKSFLSYMYYEKKFNTIVKDFIDVFPQITDVRFGKVIDEDSDEVWELQVKEEHTGWLSQDLLSTGMMKTLLHISLLHLLPDESVVFIDEVENGLGVNCLHVITEDIEMDHKRIQFVLTSHHPYIINNINIDKWKIITRNGSNVVVKDPKEFHLGKSKHEFFKQLINLDAFIEGVQ